MRSFFGYARSDPARVATIDADGTVVTYGEFAARANQLSHAMLAAGVGRGATIAALLPNSHHMLLAERAVTQLPMYFTPVNWHLAVGEIAYILRDCAAALFLTAAQYRSLAVAAADEAGLPRDRVIVLDAEGEQPDGCPGLADFAAGRSTADPAERGAGQRMLYTSGTTGRPKGVRRALPDLAPEPAAAAVVARAKLYGADHEDGRYLSVAPLYHAAPLAYAVQALEVGHTVVIGGKWDAEQALRLIEAHRITWTYLVPLMFTQLLALEPRARGRYDTTSLRAIVHTAAPCPVPVKRAMIEWVGPILNEIYGGTEGSATFIDAADWLTHPGSVGRARAGVRLRILDEAGGELGPGEVGRVYFANATNRFEYWNDPAKTAASNDGGFTTLGDIGYLDADGYLFLCDRAADIIISGGVNIYPAEIEQAMLEHPDVRDVCVVGAPDPEWGERVFAAVVPRDGVAGSTALAESIRTFLTGRIAGFKIPKEIDFRVGVPRSEVGKLLRRTLRDSLWRASGGKL